MNSYHATVWHHLTKLGGNAAVFYFVVRSRNEWNNVSKAFRQRNRKIDDARFFRIRATPRMERYHVLATWLPQSVTEAETLSASAAVDKAKSVFAHLGSLDWSAEELTGSRFFSHSREWRSIDDNEVERTGEWKREGTLGADGMSGADQIIRRYECESFTKISGQSAILNVSKQGCAHASQQVVRDLTLDLLDGVANRAPEFDPLGFGPDWKGLPGAGHLDAR